MFTIHIKTADPEFAPVHSAFFSANQYILGLAVAHGASMIHHHVWWRDQIDVRSL